MVSRGQAWSAKVRHGQLRSDMVSRGQARSAEVSRGQVWSAQVRLGQPRSDMVSRGYAMFSLSHNRIMQCYLKICFYLFGHIFVSLLSFLWNSKLETRCITMFSVVLTSRSLVHLYFLFSQHRHRVLLRKLFCAGLIAFFIGCLHQSLYLGSLSFYLYFPPRYLYTAL